MYENEYGNINTSSTPTGRSQGTGTYTDYVGYGASGQNSGSGSPDRQPKKGKGKVAAGIVALVLAGVLVGGGVSYAYMSAKDAKEAKADASEEVTESTTDTVNEEQADEKVGLTQADNSAAATEASLPTTASDGTMTVAEIAENCLPSVVAITNTGETEVRSMWGTYTQQSQSAGSGVIIGQTDDELLILTNYHVVEDNETLSVVFSWEEGTDTADDADITNAVVKDYDSSHDIAVISVNMSDLSEETKSMIRVATVGSSDNLQLGEQIVAIGNALGYGQSITTGIVSALNRTVNTSSTDGTDSSIGDSNVYIQTDAAINPGNSGGAMFNMRGELVGINSAKIGGSTVEGMGYAIPISEIFGDVENMMNQETREEVAEADRGYLGISIVDVTSDISTTYGLPVGVYISDIESGSGAEKAGLEKEEIITAINGKTVTTSSELKEYLAYYAKGDTVTLTVACRTDDGYVNKDVQVTLGENKQISSQQNTQNSDQNQSQEQDQNGYYNDGNGSSGFSFSIPFGN